LIDRDPDRAANAPPPLLTLATWRRPVAEAGRRARRRVGLEGEPAGAVDALRPGQTADVATALVVLGADTISTPADLGGVAGVAAGAAMVRIRVEIDAAARTPAPPTGAEPDVVGGRFEIQVSGITLACGRCRPVQEQSAGERRDQSAQDVPALDAFGRWSRNVCELSTVHCSSS
jgi:hypothetical protein